MPGFVVSERHTIGERLVVAEMGEVVLHAAHHRRHVVVALRHEDLEKGVVRHRRAQFVGHVHVAVLCVIPVPRPHVAGARIVQV